MNLEDEFYKYLYEEFDLKTKGKPDEDDMLAFARHFADWQKNQILNNNIADYVVFQKYIGKIGLEAVISKPGYETVWDADKIEVIAIEKDKL